MIREPAESSFTPSHIAAAVRAPERSLTAA
jgi:hypothetical protein